MLHAVITTIQTPTGSVVALVNKLSESGGKLIVAGDKKGPDHFNNPSGRDWAVSFLSLEDQEKTGFELSRELPTGHYTRKNLAYLAAIRDGATCIYETDDDNAPNSEWMIRSESIQDCRVVESAENRWVNVYRFFSEENIWPRGLPLDEISSQLPSVRKGEGFLQAPVQQGLVNGSPDVDAIWRLAMDRPFTFDQAKSVYLEPGNWCPFNTQSTWWWKLAFPLLYIPSYCSFRMCDIWKSFIAQRCLWALDLGIVFHAPEVDQDRNLHDLMRDFTDEIPGYTRNREICNILDSASLEKDPEAVKQNMRRCYELLIAADVFPEKEMELVDAWLRDLDAMGV